MVSQSTEAIAPITARSTPATPPKARWSIGPICVKSVPTAVITAEKPFAMTSPKVFNHPTIVLKAADSHH
jgi:hypothetical protein